ncbi:MAG: hydrolase 2, exosortase A system-associated [Candidatus Accumulibacter sp.]|jgi:exosortase A-associated hydrolase 2|nr:hydrolase 2, exosortase A system-associated [Accumulibacter sp.]
MAFEAFFLPAATGKRFCILHPVEAGVPARGAVVYIHPFAEEMNRARRMAAAQARALALAGYAALRIDLYGCGDSAGDFGDASWPDWIDDALLARDWLRERTGMTPWFWGLRAGCLVAAEAARRGGAVGGLLFWQPVASGKSQLQQFLRLKAAAEIMSGEGAETVKRLKDELVRGHAVEVAGYTLSPGLANGLENAELSPPERPTRVEWLEVAGSTNAELPAATSARLEKWRAQGHAARGVAVTGPPFWLTAETAECPALLAATLAALET